MLGSTGVRLPHPARCNQIGCSREEIMATLTKRQARDLTNKIRLASETLIELVAEAYQGRVWLALGYDTWADYIAGEFEIAPLRCSREDRPVIVKALRAFGLSSRAIAPVPARVAPQPVRMSLT